MATVQSSSPPEQVGVVPDAGQIAVAKRNGHVATAPAVPAQADKAPAEKPKITQETIDARIEKLLRQVQANRLSEDLSLTRKAWEFCVRHNAGQERASG